MCVTEAQRLKMLRLLIGFDDSPQGSIRYDGIDIQGFHPGIKKKMRGLVLSRQFYLLEARLRKNTTVGPIHLSTEALLWVLD